MEDKSWRTHMSINSNYNVSSPAQYQATDKRANLKSAFDSLGSALQSGDLNAAKQAFSQIQNAHKGHAHHHHDNDGDDSKQASGPGADFKALSDALSSNNLQAAQQAWSKLQADRKGAGQGPQAVNQPAESAPFQSSDSIINVSA